MRGKRKVGSLTILAATRRASPRVKPAHGHPAGSLAHPKEPWGRLVNGADISYDKFLSGGHLGNPMRLIGSFIEHLQRWFTRYRTELVHAEARNQYRQSLAEIEWNGAMIGDLRRRSLDA